MTGTEIQKTLLELSFSIGNSNEKFNFDLVRVLQNTIPLFIEKLGLIGACVLKDTDQGLQVIYESSLVENPCFPKSEIALEHIVGTPDSAQIQSYQIIRESYTHRIFNLNNFGILILSGEKPLDSDLLSQLLPVISLFEHECNLNVISDFLDFSKIKSGQITLDKTDFNIHELCHKIFDFNKYRAEEKKISFQCSVDPAIQESINGDSVRLHQVLNNLVSNAIKFTNEGSVELLS